MNYVPPVPPPPSTQAPHSALPLSGASAYRAALAAELVLDLESRRLSIEQVLYKARRLANALSDTQMEDWIGCELGGYLGDLPPHVEALARSVGRFTPAPVMKPKSEDQGGTKRELVYPAEQQQLTYAEALPRLETAVLPKLDENAGQAAATARGIRNRSTLHGGRRIDPTAWEEAVPRLQLQAITIHAISKRVRAELHKYASAAYHRNAFREIAASIFERHKKSVDVILAEVAPDVVEKMPSVYERLADPSDVEAISQAMSTTRRMIAAFADAVLPPRAGPAIDAEGQSHELKQRDVLNRIQQALREGCSSSSRVERLAGAVRRVHDRVSAGMKADISRDEAESLILATYLTLGEIAAAIHRSPAQ